MAKQHKQKKSFSWLIISLALLAVLAVSGMFYFYNRSVKEEKEQPAEKVVKDYQKLEDSYEKAIQELEKASKGDFSDVDILKQNLSQILQEIKQEKQEIKESRDEFEQKAAEERKQRAEELKQKLEMSKEVADSYLVKQLEKVKQAKEALEEENQELSQEKTQIAQNLQNIKTEYETKKAENAQLNSIVEDIEQKVNELEQEEDQKTKELQELKEKKKQFEKELDQSNQVIEQQSSQINNLTKTLRKVNLDTYFYFHQGDPEKEARIFLTENGVSKQYENYFQEKAPEVFTDFKLNKDLFEDGLQKVEFKVLNSNNVEVYTMSKVIHEEDLTIKIPPNKLEVGKTYYIKLKNGDEDLVVGGKYPFQI